MRERENDELRDLRLKGPLSATLGRGIDRYRSPTQETLGPNALRLLTIRNPGMWELECLQNSRYPVIITSKKIISKKIIDVYISFGCWLFSVLPHSIPPFFPSTVQLHQNSRRHAANSGCIPQSANQQTNQPTAATATTTTSKQTGSYYTPSQCLLLFSCWSFTHATSNAFAFLGYMNFE